jgi:hypothetical protein
VRAQFEAQGRAITEPAKLARPKRRSIAKQKLADVQTQSGMSPDGPAASRRPPVACIRCDHRHHRAGRRHRRAGFRQARRRARSDDLASEAGLLEQRAATGQGGRADACAAVAARRRAQALLATSDLLAAGRGAGRQMPEQRAGVEERIDDYNAAVIVPRAIDQFNQLLDARTSS